MSVGMTCGANRQILFGALFNSGQVCMSTERVLVHASVMPQMEAALLGQWREVADKPFDVVRAESVKEVQDMVSEAVTKVRQSSGLGRETG
jgi:acyl-CoA reductase-like NAD-dependent aldehyde dehydrogenase